MPSPGAALKMTKIHLQYTYLVSCLLAINITVNTVVEFQPREVNKPVNSSQINYQCNHKK